MILSMHPLRMAGIVFFATGGVFGAVEIIQMFLTPTWTGMSLGKLWYGISPGSLNFVQAIIERYIAEFLWQSIFFPLLMLPAWIFFFILGMILFVLGRPSADKLV
jgi:hypothetical protein